MIENTASFSVHSLIEQYGFPTPEYTSRFKYLLSADFVEYPPEMNPLIDRIKNWTPTNHMR
jgi:hypothetical protein